MSLLPPDEATKGSVEGQVEKEKTGAQLTLLQELYSEHSVWRYFHRKCVRSLDG